MGGKSSGGYDTGPMLEYGNKALDLQKEMYDDQKQMIQPWVNTGSSALDMLGGYLGINSAKSPSTRQNLLDQYKDQFTTTSGTQGTLMTGPDGKVYDTSSTAWHKDFMNKPGTGGYNQMKDLATALNLSKGNYAALGFKPVSQQTSTTDSEALNAYVDAKLAEMGANAESDPNFGSLLESFDETKFRADPGYQFRLDEQNKAIERAAASRGQYFDPSTVKALTEYGGNLADQTYNDAYNRYNNDQNNIFNRLASVAGIGQTATGQMVGAGQNYANQAGNIYGQMGNAITASNAAKAAQPSMFNTLLGVGGQVLGGWAGSGFARG